MVVLMERSHQLLQLGAAYSEAHWRLESFAGNAPSVLRSFC